jgi:hypothetical protein
MTAIPVPPRAVRLALASRAFDARRPVAALERRHVPVRPDARILSVVGLSGDNLLLGIGLGRLDAPVPEVVIVCPEPRDPILALRFAAEAGGVLAPLVDTALAAATPTGWGPVCDTPPQLWVDGARTVAAIRAWTFRLRNPWLPSALAAIEDRRVEGQRTFSLLRGILAAADTPGADVVVDVAGALGTHLVFPLADGEEATPLPVLLACLDLDGTTEVLEAVEGAEDGQGVSATADPDWDNSVLLPALHRFKRRRRTLAAGRAAALVDPEIVTRSATESGIDSAIGAALAARHRAVAAGVGYLAQLPALPGLRRRAQRAGWRVFQDLSRGRRGDPAWADFPSLPAGVLLDHRDLALLAEADLDALRGDRRAFAFTQATGEATLARATSVSVDGRLVTLELAVPLDARTEQGWWWLDDTHIQPIAGNLAVTGPTSATWTITQQMRRLAANPTILTNAETLRLTSREGSFPGRPYFGGDPARGHATPVMATAPTPFASPINFAALGD